LTCFLIVIQYYKHQKCWSCSQGLKIGECLSWYWRNRKWGSVLYGVMEHAGIFREVEFSKYSRVFYNSIEHCCRVFYSFYKIFSLAQRSLYFWAKQQRNNWIKTIWTYSKNISKIMRITTKQRKQHSQQYFYRYWKAFFIQYLNLKTCFFCFFVKRLSCSISTSNGRPNKKKNKTKNIFLKACFLVIFGTSNFLENILSRLMVGLLTLRKLAKQTTCQKEMMSLLCSVEL